MKPIEPLIDSISTALTGNPALLPLIGTFKDSASKATPKAIAYGTLPERYTVPDSTKVYIIYNLEFSVPKSNQGKSFLQDVSLKFYIGGFDSPKVADILTEQFNNTLISTYVASPKGMTMMPSGDITLRFNLI